MVGYCTAALSRRLNPYVLGGIVTKSNLFVLAALLFVIGVGVVVWEPAGPEVECAKDPLTTSGFFDAEKNCPVSIESYERIREWETRLRWDNIVGAVLVVGGIGAAIVGALKKSRTAISHPPQRT